MIVPPLASMRSAPGTTVGMSLIAPTKSILPSAMTSAALRTGGRPVPSTSVPLVMTVVPAESFMGGLRERRWQHRNSPFQVLEAPAKHGKVSVWWSRHSCLPFSSQAGKNACSTKTELSHHSIPASGSTNLHPIASLAYHCPMLRELAVQNLAVIEDVRVEL